VFSRKSLDPISRVPRMDDVQYRGKLYDAAAVSRLLVKYCVDAFDHLDETEEAGNAGRGWDDLRHWAEHRVEDGVVRCGPFASTMPIPGASACLATAMPVTTAPYGSVMSAWQRSARSSEPQGFPRFRLREGTTDNC
jgi:hypothetical protein